MSLRAGCILGIVWMIGNGPSQLWPAPAVCPVAQAAGCRSFTVKWAAAIPPCPAGAARLDVWVPVPGSDTYQTICDVSVKSDLPHDIVVETEYQNRSLHVWSDQHAAGSAELTYRCIRYEEHVPFPARQWTVSSEPAPTPRDLAPDRLGVIDDRIRQTARSITAGHADSAGQVRAIYDYVISHMVYDKTAPGWGSGDTIRACTVGKGNCTDFHALFIALARARGIPARFEIGLQLPADKRQGTIEGYHCWAEFWLAGTGWVPVDCSEAWKHPERHEFYFGNLDADRMRLSAGRDVRLAAMRGPPLNYFLWPYAEVDGKPVSVGRGSVTFTSGPATGNGHDVPVSPSHRASSP